MWDGTGWVWGMEGPVSVRVTKYFVRSSFPRKCTKYKYVRSTCPRARSTKYDCTKPTGSRAEPGRVESLLPQVDGLLGCLILPYSKARYEGIHIIIHPRVATDDSQANAATRGRARPASQVAALTKPSSATGLLERNRQPVTGHLNAVGQTRRPPGKCPPPVEVQSRRVQQASHVGLLSVSVSTSPLRVRSRYRSARTLRMYSYGQCAQVLARVLVPCNTSTRQTQSMQHLLTIRPRKAR